MSSDVFLWLTWFFPTILIQRKYYPHPIYSWLERTMVWKYSNQIQLMWFQAKQICNFSYLVVSALEPISQSTFMQSYFSHIVPPLLSIFCSSSWPLRLVKFIHYCRSTKYSTVTILTEIRKKNCIVIIDR